MDINSLSELIAVLLAVSLATERLVLAIRTPDTLFWMIPWGKWLNDEEREEENKVLSRRLVIQLLAFLCAVFTAGWLAAPWNPLAQIEISGQSFPLWLVAVLATGGSSFWKNMLGYTKAARDLRKKQAE